jgi:hypothetical protein
MITLGLSAGCTKTISRLSPGLRHNTGAALLSVAALSLPRYAREVNMITPPRLKISFAAAPSRSSRRICVAI